VKPRLFVTTDFWDLKKAGKDATGDLQSGERLSAAAVRRLPCDAGVTPVVLGGDSEILDQGREERYVTKAAPSRPRPTAALAVGRAGHGHTSPAFQPVC
jgi:hypothetical protein